MKTIDSLLEEVRACRACAEMLPLGPRPVVQISAAARILIASQAPGTKVHESGVSFSDTSGDRLREWMGVADHTSMTSLESPSCRWGCVFQDGWQAVATRRRVRNVRRSGVTRFCRMPNLRLTLLVGAHAQIGALGPGEMTQRVMTFRDHLPAIFPLPHPSWRSRLWAAKNPWFEAEVLPALRDAVQHALL